MSQIYSHVVDVALPIPFAETLSYYLGDGVRPAIGSRVWVELGQKQRVGIITSYHQNFISNNTLKPILLDLDCGQPPTIGKDLLKELRWAANYYHVPLGEFISLGIPQNLRKKYLLASSVEYSIMLNSDLVKDIRLGKKQAEVVELLARGNLKEKDLIKALNINKKILTPLIEKGILVRTTQAPPQVINVNKDKRLSLNQDQKNVIENISKKIDRFCPHIIHGVTGSGKTEIYIRLIEMIVHQKKQALLVVPEIALTPQLVDRLSATFGDTIGIIHSDISSRKKMDAWLKARTGEIFCIVGTRSASFSQFKNLGIIIIDEEHDQSLNQSSKQSYSARDFLTYRAKCKNIPIILGSATPSLETFYNVQNKKYDYYYIGDRANKATLPTIKLIDLNFAKQKNGISIDLASAIKEHTNNNKQVLIFINRKGYAPVLYCNKCHDVERCNRCSSNMVVYERWNYVKCQLCNNKRSITRSCNKCSGSRVPIGVGTQRVKLELEQLFPDKNTIIIDNDFINSESKLKEVMEKIKDGQADIIVGTQIISKGHDFPNITLVGVIDGDHGLYGIDFRSQEKMAQLLFQVSGRSGRGTDSGEVIIQTHNISHPTYKYLSEHNYVSFLDYLLKQRKETDWPPFTHLIALRISSKNEHKLTEQLNAIKTLIKKNQLKINVLGPVFDIIKKRKNMYSGHLLIKQNNRRILHEAIHQIKLILSMSSKTKGINLKIDVDPYEL
jgi:primosomal protein N' (replication factor Y)